MKKTLFAILATLALAASALEVTPSLGYDSSVDKTVARVAVSGGNFNGFVPTFVVQHAASTYERYSVGANYTLAKVGPVEVAATSTGFYQTNYLVDSGYGFTLGGKASYELTKNAALVLTAERVLGQARVADGNVVALGLNVKF